MDAEITLTPTTDDDGSALRAQHSTPEVAAWWDLPDPGFPMHDEPESTRFTIRHGGEIAGLIQYGEENEPKYHAAIRSYEKAGFQRVGILKLAERDSDGNGWHDALMMELVVDPTTHETLPPLRAKSAQLASSLE